MSKTQDQTNTDPIEEFLDMVDNSDSYEEFEATLLANAAKESAITDESKIDEQEIERGDWRKHAVVLLTTLTAEADEYPQKSVEYTTTAMVALINKIEEKSLRGSEPEMEELMEGLRSKLMEIWQNNPVSPTASKAVVDAFVDALISSQKTPTAPKVDLEEWQKYVTLSKQLLDPGMERDRETLMEIWSQGVVGNANIKRDCGRIEYNSPSNNNS